MTLVYFTVEGVSTSRGRDLSNGNRDSGGGDGDEDDIAPEDSDRFLFDCAGLIVLQKQRQMLEARIIEASEQSKPFGSPTVHVVS